jgi:AraC-like DNA-binding protein
LELLALQLHEILSLDDAASIGTQKELTLISKALNRKQRAGYQKDFTIIRLAKNIGTNETPLKYTFKKIMGTTIHKYYQDFRMKAAVDMLEQGSAIGKVAVLAGYKHIGHFSNSSKAIHGVSPSRFCDTSKALITP